MDNQSVNAFRKVQEVYHLLKKFFRQSTSYRRTDGALSKAESLGSAFVARLRWHSKLPAHGQTSPKT
jgi:hypothetical protein